MAIDLSRGLEGLAGSLEKTLGEINGATSTHLERAALVLEGAIKVELSTPGRGRIYPRGKKRTHQASAPGDPPAVDTGRLRSSITHGVIAGEMRVGTNVDYAAPLEYGDLDDGGSRAPRPFMRTALEKALPSMTGVTVDSLKRKKRA